MTLEIGPQNAPDLVAGLGMLALAALVLWVAPANRVHRAFALMQVVLAGGSLAFVGAVGYLETERALSVTWDAVGVYFMLAWPFAAAFFTLRFLDPEGRGRASRPVAWGLLVGVVLVLGAFALDHALFTAPGPGGRHEVLGPLGLILRAPALTYGAIALLFALGAHRAEAAPRRSGLALGAAAFSMPAAYWGAALLAAMVARPDGFVGSVAANAAVAVLSRALPWAGVLTVIATIAIAHATAPLRNDAATRRERRLLAAGTLFGAATGLAATGLILVDPAAWAWVRAALDGVWRIVLTALLAYALLERQLFDIDVKVRWTISRSTIAAAFIAVFFVASEGAQIVFGQGNEWVGLLAAGALVFAIAPLQRAAERLAERAVPAAAGGAVAAAPAADGREARYRAAVRLACRDRHLTREEERALTLLALDLRIPAERAYGILDEEAAASRRGSPQPEVPP